MSETSPSTAGAVPTTRYGQFTYAKHEENPALSDLSGSVEASYVHEFIEFINAKGKRLVKIGISLPDGKTNYLLSTEPIADLQDRLRDLLGGKGGVARREAQKNDRFVGQGSDKYAQVGSPGVFGTSPVAGLPPDDLELATRPNSPNLVGSAQPGPGGLAAGNLGKPDNLTGKVGPGNPGPGNSGSDKPIKVS